MSDALCPIFQIILPFTLAFLFLLSYAYDLDPLMVFWGVSETVRARRSLYANGCRLNLRHSSRANTDHLPHSAHSRALRQEAAHW